MGKMPGAGRRERLSLKYIDVDQVLRRNATEYLPAAPHPTDDCHSGPFAALDADVAVTRIRAIRHRAALRSGPAVVIPTSAEMGVGNATSSGCARRIVLFLSRVCHADHERGLASYWHARLLREADFIPQRVPGSIKCHSDVVRPIAAGEQSRSASTPTTWLQPVGGNRQEIKYRCARRSCAEDDDFSFLRNHLTAKCHGDGVFGFSDQQSGQVKVSRGYRGSPGELLMEKFNFGAPRISVASAQRRTLVLEHDSQLDGRGSMPNGVQGIGLCQARLAPTRAAQDGRRGLAAVVHSRFGSRGRLLAAASPARLPGTRTRVRPGTPGRQRIGISDEQSSPYVTVGDPRGAGRLLR